MTVKMDMHLVSEILKSPNAPILIAEVSSILEKEKQKRAEFYNQITEQEKAEFINGEIIIHSPVKKNHNEISGNLFTIFKSYVVENNLGFVGIEKILIQCTRNDYEPDICFFGKEKTSKLKKDQSLFPIPDLIVEILSKGTQNRDRGIKFNDYQNHGVLEYWIIDPVAKTVEQFLLNNKGKYELNIKAKSGLVSSKAIQKLSIPIPVIFSTLKTHQFIKSLFI